MGHYDDLYEFYKDKPVPTLNGNYLPRKTKVKPQTNEEWRKTCSTEEFAEWMAQYCCDVDTSDVKEILKQEWLEWLKQPHKE